MESVTSRETDVKMSAERRDRVLQGIKRREAQSMLQESSGGGGGTSLGSSSFERLDLSSSESFTTSSSDMARVRENLARQRHLLDVSSREATTLSSI